MTMRSLAASSVIATCLLVAAAASAQQPGAESPPAAAEPAAPPPPVSPPPPPPPAPAPPPHEEKGEVKLPPVRFYGMLRPTLVIAGRAAESFSNPNESAITAAANPVLAPLHDTERATFHVAQSRFGFQLNEKGQFRGHLEIDFYDSTKATPTVASMPRLRIATVDWVPSEHFTLSVGQDWDLHSPLNPYTINLVGLGFESGNTGFMRQQIKAIVTIDDAIELAGAVGMQGLNITATDSAVEIGHFPSFAARIAAIVGKTGRIGISGIATRLTFSQALPTERLAGGLGGAAYADVTPYEALNFRFEGYIGRNQANMGMLALGQGNVDSDADELGGFVSAHHTIVKGHAIYAMGGFAQILNANDVMPSYQYPAAAAGAPAPAPSTATSNGTGPGMRWNWSARLAYEVSPIKAVSFITEGFVLQSKHVLLAVDQGRFKATQIAPGVEMGLIYTF